MVVLIPSLCLLAGVTMGRILLTTAAVALLIVACSAKFIGNDWMTDLEGIVPFSILLMVSVNYEVKALGLLS